MNKDIHVPQNIKDKMKGCKPKHKEKRKRKRT